MMKERYGRLFRSIISEIMSGLKTMLMDGCVYKAILMCLLMFSCNMVLSKTETDSSEQDEPVVVRMNDGKVYIGTILEREGHTIILKTTNGEFHLNAQNVSSIERYDVVEKSKPADPNAVLYFVGPTGIPIKRGKGYYHNIGILFNSVDYGVTDYISIGGGIGFFATTFSGIRAVLGSEGTIEPPSFILRSRVGSSLSKNVHVGFGLMVADASWLPTSIGGGYGYGVLAFGDGDSNLSITAGIASTDSSALKLKNPVIMVSAVQRMSSWLSLMTENIIIPIPDGYFGVFSINGVRMKDSFDVGVASFMGGNGILPIPIPYFGFGYAF